MIRRSKRALAKAKIRDELDDLWRAYVKDRAGGRCELGTHADKCSGLSDHAHHIFTKGSSQNLRWDPLNGIGLSVACHYAAHGSNTCTEYLARIIDVIGVDAFETIRSRQSLPFRVNAMSIECVKAQLTHQVKPRREHGSHRPGNAPGTLEDRHAEIQGRNGSRHPGKDHPAPDETGGPTPALET
jgi:hypothetical protein